MWNSKDILKYDEYEVQKFTTTDSPDPDPTNQSIKALQPSSPGITYNIRVRGTANGFFSQQPFFKEVPG